MGGTITSRSWRVKHPEQQTTHIVQLRHNNVSGRRELLVDGRSITNSIKIMDAEENIKFNIAGKEGVVMIRIDYFTFTYACKFDGRPMPEMTFDICDHEEKEYECKIPSVSTRMISEKRVAVFRVEMTCEGETHTFVKRFRDFVTFDAFLRGAYDGHHLLQNLPRLPPRHNPIFTNHFAKPFLEERRKQLETYVNKLVKVPKVVNNPDFLSFLWKKKKKKKPDEKRGEEGATDSKSQLSGNKKSENKSKQDDQESRDPYVVDDIFKHVTDGGDSKSDVGNTADGEGLVEGLFDDDDDEL
eukprot:jgi/Bigna1/78783/fgenesh1_pg.57_\